MPKKPVTESRALRCSFDQAGDIGDNKGPKIAEVDNAKVWLQSSKRVVGDFRLCGGDNADQRRLSGIRKADESDVGEQF